MEEEEEEEAPGSFSVSSFCQAHPPQGEEGAPFVPTDRHPLPAASFPCLPSLLLKDYNTPKC